MGKMKNNFKLPDVDVTQYAAEDIRKIYIGNLQIVACMEVS